MPLLSKSWCKRPAFKDQRTPQVGVPTKRRVSYNSVIQQHRNSCHVSKTFSHLNTSANPRLVTHKLFKAARLFASLDTIRTRTSRGRCSILSKPSAAGPAIFVGFCEPWASKLAGSIFSIAYVRGGVINKVLDGFASSENA